MINLSQSAGSSKRRAEINFRQQLLKTRTANNSLLCVGLDTDPKRIPDTLKTNSQSVFEFNRQIIDATYDLVSVYKPQIAYYGSEGREDELLATIEYIHSKQVPVILDAKRGDIGSTAEQYAREAFERFNADAVTINPYLGLDAMQPFLDYQDKGVIILCRTSNPGGADLQNLKLESGQHLYEYVAELAATHWNQHNNVNLVVGATQPQELAQIRQIVGEMDLLIPGIGAQGGDVAATMKAGGADNMMISSSRGIIYAGNGTDFALKARQAAIATRDEINQYR